MSLDLSYTAVRPTEVFAVNVTHNLTRLAAKVGVYACMWRPDESGIASAADMIAPLEEGLRRIDALSDAEVAPLLPSNGWGTRAGLRDAIERALAAAKANPDAKVTANR